MEIISNTLTEKETKNMTKQTLDFVANCLSKTLGPYGSTTIIQDRFLNHVITKDGYTVLKNMTIRDNASRTILDLVQKISKTLVRKVGDGSTSSIIIANYLFSFLIQMTKEYNLPPKDILDILNKLSEIIEKEIKDNAICINDDNFDRLADIASVSTNNDKEMGLIIKNIFKQVGKYGFIHVEKSKTEKTWFDNTRGFEVTRGYINKLMVTEKDEKTAIVLNPSIFMTNGYLTEEDMPMMAELIGTVCLKAGAPLVLLCNGVDQAFETFIHMNLMQKNNIKLLIVDISLASKETQERFTDLAINLGCIPFNKKEREQYPNEVQELLPRLGSCLKVVSTEHYTRFIEGKGDKSEIKARVETINLHLSSEILKDGHIDNDQTIYELRKRLALLQNKMVTLYVGGPTENEKDTKKYLVEDAVSACKSTMNFGYIIGGNLIIPQIIYEKKNMIIEDLSKVFSFISKEAMEYLISGIFDAFAGSYKTVLKNKFLNDDKSINEILEKCIKDKCIFNLKRNEYETNEQLSVINSAETDIEIMKSAFSIIGLVATSNQLIKLNLNE